MRASLLQIVFFSVGFAIAACPFAAADETMMGTTAARKGTNLVGHFYTCPSLGVSSIHYKEGSLAYSAVSLTGKVSTRYPIAPAWDLGGSGYLTLLPLKQSPSSNAARFLGLNARVGFAPKSVAPPWRLSLLTGVYYTRMVVEGEAFGFKDMVGPQLFPVLARLLGNGDSAILYLKYSPVNNRISLSFSNREMAAGLTYAQLLKKGGVLTYSLDYANLALAIDGVQTAASTLTLSIGTNL